MSFFVSEPDEIESLLNEEQYQAYLVDEGLLDETGNPIETKNWRVVFEINLSKLTLDDELSENSDRGGKVKGLGKSRKSGDFWQFGSKMAFQVYQSW